MASADTIAIFTPLGSMPPPGVQPATLDLRDKHVVLDFDDTLVQGVAFTGVVPSHYEGGNLQAVLTWAATSATSDDVRWQVLFERHQIEYLDLDSYAVHGRGEATDTVNATSGKLTQTTIECSTNNGGVNPPVNPIAGESIRFFIIRDVSHAADTMTGDAELVSVEIREA